MTPFYSVSVCSVLTDPVKKVSHQGSVKQTGKRVKYWKLKSCSHPLVLINEELAGNVKITKLLTLKGCSFYGNIVSYNYSRPNFKSSKWKAMRDKHAGCCSLAQTHCFAFNILQPRPRPYAPRASWSTSASRTFPSGLPSTAPAHTSM